MHSPINKSWLIVSVKYYILNKSKNEICMSAPFNNPTPLFDTLENLTSNIISFPPLNEGDAALDHKHAVHFLYHYRGSLATFNSYRR